MIEILHGDALEKIKLIKDKSIDCIVTSPPYWRLRDYENEYQESHRLLKQYEKTENIDPMKYELAKLFYINNRIESDIYSENKTVPRKKLVDIRSRVLNDFNKYMQVVMKKDKQFNFANYYKKSPFSDESITIKAPTLKYSLEYFKQLLHLL